MITAETRPYPWSAKGVRLIDLLLEALKDIVSPADRWYESGYAVRQYTVPVSGRRRLQGGATKGNDRTPIGFHGELILAVLAASAIFPLGVVAYIRDSHGTGDRVLSAFAVETAVVPGGRLDEMVARIRHYYAEAA